MKNPILLLKSLLLIAISIGCEEPGNESLKLPFGGKINNFQSAGITQNDLTSSLWFFENGCVFLVDDCDSFRLGTIELAGGQLLFSASSEWLNSEHCSSSEALVDVLKNLSGTYNLSSGNILTITTDKGDAIEIHGSNVIIQPLCEAEDFNK